MSNWSSFDDDKGITDAWRTFLKEEPEPAAVPEEPTERPPAPPSPRATAAKPIFGLTSKQPDSLISILGQLGFLTPEQLQGIVSKFAEIADDEDVVLEAVALKGAQSEQDRVFGPESTQEIGALINALDLKEPATQRKALLKAINYWARVNTVKFSTPTATPAAVAPPVSTKLSDEPSLDDLTEPAVKKPDDGAQLVTRSDDEEVEEEKDEEKAEVAKQKLDKAIEANDEGGMLDWGNKWLRWNPITGPIVGFANGIEFFKEQPDMPIVKRTLGALILMAGTTLDSFMMDKLADEGFEQMAEGNYVEGVMTIIGGEYEKFMKFAGACNKIAPVVCEAKIWATISAALVAAATAVGSSATMVALGAGGVLTGGGMSALMLAIPGIVCPMSLIYAALPKEGLPNLDNIKEFADDPYFKAGYKASTEKAPIGELIKPVAKGIGQGYGLEGKKLVKPATKEQKNNYTKYLLGLKAQQKQDEAIELVAKGAANLAKKSEPAPEAEAAVQQEHMIYERWQLIAGINKRVI